MREIPTYIEDHQSVVDAYGYWPSFHDSPVLRFARDTDAIELEVEAWEMTSNIDSRGYYILTKRHEIGFRICGITEAELEGCIAENILFELGFSSVTDAQLNGHFQVELDSVMGSNWCGLFSAATGKVTFVRPSSTPHSA